MKSQQNGPYKDKWKILAIICMALFIIMLDVSVVNVALPSIKAYFGADQAQVSWVLNGYTLIFASTLILSGRLADKKGLKKIFITGLAIFLGASLLCALSTSIYTLIAWRVVQALGASLIMPVSLSLVTTAFPAEERGTAIGIWGATSGISSAAGPAVGGLICDVLSWKWIFFLNVPFILAALYLTTRYLKESVPDTTQQLDIVGALLSIVMLLCLALGLTFVSEAQALTTRALILFALAVAGLLGFIAYERNVAQDPILDLAIFRERMVTLGVMNGFLLMFGMMAIFYVMPLYYQLYLGSSPMRAGAVLMPLTLVMLVVTPLCGKLADKTVPKYLMLGGSVVAAVSVAAIGWLVLTGRTSLMWLPMIFAGLGMAFLQTPLSAAVMSAIPEGKEGSGSGVLTTFRQVGALFGVAAITVLLVSGSAPAAAQASAQGAITPQTACLSLVVVAVGYAVAAILSACMPAEKNVDMAKRQAHQK